MATVATRTIGPADHGRRMTLAEFREVEGTEGYRYELARGVIEVSLVPGGKHGQVVSNLYLCVAGYYFTHPGVILRFGGGGEFRIYVPEMESGRNPDLAVLLAAAPKAQRIAGVPSLAAEVVSARSGPRDHRDKRAEYLAYGLREYWIVDLIARRFTLLIRDGDAWREQVVADDQVIPSVVLPGLTTTVADLWAKLDDYDEDDPDEFDLGPADAG